MSKQDGRLTGLFGAPVSDRENSMTAATRSIINARCLLFRTNVTF